MGADYPGICVVVNGGSATGGEARMTGWNGALKWQRPVSTWPGRGKWPCRGAVCSSETARSSQNLLVVVVSMTQYR